jgi:hypothetical protein
LLEANVILFSIRKNPSKQNYDQMANFIIRFYFNQSEFFFKTWRAENRNVSSDGFITKKKFEFELKTAIMLEKIEYLFF